MTKKNSFNLKKLFSNDWVITVTATLIGVFVALYLTEWLSNKKVLKQKEIASKNILAEITKNENNLKSSIANHKEFFETMQFISTYTDDDENLIAPISEMNALRSNYPHLVEINDSTILNDGLCKYHGEINTNLSIPHIQLSTIAWKTFKNSGINSTYTFDCLMYLETIDKITDEVLTKDSELFDYLLGTKDSGQKNELLLTHVKLLIQFEESLLKIYEPRKEELKNCG